MKLDQRVTEMYLRFKLPSKAEVELEGRWGGGRETAA